MIESISITNFQAHVGRRVIDLDPGVTVLVGPSDTGKSSVLRAIRWVLLNEVSGDFISWNNFYAKVSVEFDDGRSVVRKKSDKENYYSLDNKDPYDAVGRTVPPDIAALFAVSELNFQGQMDAPFWLADSPGEVSRQLNHIVDLGIIDDSLANIASELRDAKAAEKFCQARLDMAKEKADSLVWTQEASWELDLLSSDEEAVLQERDRASNLASLLADARIADRVRSDAAAAAVDAKSVVELGRRVMDEMSRAEDLQNRLSCAIFARSKMIEGTSFYDESEDIAEMWIGEIRDQTTKVEELARLLKSAKQNKEDWRNYQNEATIRAAELNGLAQGICPLCGKGLG